MAGKDRQIGNVERGRAPLLRRMGPADDLDRLMDAFFSRGLMPAAPFERPLLAEFGNEARTPRADVIDRENEILVRAEMPGVDKKDLEVTVDENMVSIRAESAHEEKQTEGDYYRCEISRGSFVRTLALPAYVDSEKAKASFKDGILELTLPKLEQSKRRQIQVQ